MKYIFSFFILFAVVFSVEKYKEIRIYDDAKEVVYKLKNAGLDIDHIYIEPDLWIEFVIAENKITLLDETQLHYEIMHEDIEQYYESRLDNHFESRDFEFGSMGGYYTFNEIEDQLDNLYANFPELITQKVSIGETLEGRNIWMVKISDNPNIDENEPEMLYTGLHHAREPMSYMNLFYFMDWLTDNYGTDPEATALVNNRELYFIPAVNPDGLVYNQQIAPNGGGMQRKNMRETCFSSVDGVDLNRNYSYMWGLDDTGSSSDGCNETYRGLLPFSEPETQAVRDFVDSHNFQIALNYHSYSNLLIYPFGYTYDNPVPQDDLDIFIEYGEQMVQFNGYALGAGPDLLYPVNGEACDWMYGVHGIFAYTPEVGNSSDGFWPSTARIIPLAEENLYPNKFVAWSVGAKYEVDFSIQDGPFNPGDTYLTDLSIFNSGLGDSNGMLTVSIDSPDDWLFFETESVEVGTLDSRREINLGDILSFSISQTAPSGTSTEIILKVVDDDGYEHIANVEIIIGTPIVLAQYDFEENSDWIVGDSDDNASAGIWELAIPVATSYNGEQAQPGIDHSENGEKCFITGAATSPGSVGYDDVDGGKTTLLSPVFDFSDETEILVSYWRWYTNNVGDNPGTDRWKVEVTSDSGESWEILEETSQSQNSWVQKTFLLSNYNIDFTDKVQFRFIAEDINNIGDTGSGGSIVEAAIDDFIVSSFNINESIQGDLNNDGQLDVLDVVSMVNLVLANNFSNLADMNLDNDCNVLDVVILVNLILE